MVVVVAVVVIVYLLQQHIIPSPHHHICLLTLSYGTTPTEKNHRLLACLDIYPNIDRIKHVNCPVFVLHGKLDQEVDVSHGRDLYKATPPEFQRDPWWVPDRGHNDITDGSGKLAEYIRRLRNFLSSID